MVSFPSCHLQLRLANFVVICGLLPFLQPLFALDTASVLASTAIMMRNFSRSLVVRSSTVGKSSSLALL